MSGIRRRALAALVLGAALSPAFAATLTIQPRINGEPPDDPQRVKFFVYEPGKREIYLAWGHAKKAARIPDGPYDVVVRYRNDAVVEDIVWEELELEGRVHRLVDFRVATAGLTVQVTRDGLPVPPYTARFGLYPVGRRDRPLVVRRPGQHLTYRPGTYDVEVVVRNPLGLQTIWLENYALAGERAETVEVGSSAAQLRLTLLDGGRPLPAAAGRWEAYERGTRERPIARGASGEARHLPAGTYDIALFFRRGAETVERWMNRVEVRGTERREVEISGEWTSLSVAILRDGRALEDAWFEVHPARGEREALAVGRAGGEVQLSAGTYDIGCFWRSGGVKVQRWLDDRSVSGRTRFEVDLEFRRASLRVLPPASAAPGKPATVVNVLLIVDSSQAMGVRLGEGSRLEQFRDALPRSLVGVTSFGTNLSLHAYGIAPRASRNCRDSVELLPMEPLDRRALSSALLLLRPSGEAAVAYALETGAARLPPAEDNAIVLVAADADGCGANACAVASRLLRDGKAERIFVVDLGADSGERRELACIGDYLAARDVEELRAALRSVFGELQRRTTGRVTVFEADGGARVTAGALGERLDLVAGRYDVRIREGERSYLWRDVAIEGDLRARAGPEPPR